MQEEAIQASISQGQKNAYAGQTVGGWTEAMMVRLFNTDLPARKEEYDEFYKMMPVVMAALPTIPNIPVDKYDHLVRVWQDIREQSASEGMERVTASDILQLLFEVKLLTARGDAPLPGLTGVSALITSRSQQEHVVKMPTQAEPSGGGFFGFLKRK